MIDTPHSIFGRGLSYPMQLDAQGIRPLVTSGEDLVLRSIGSIINTDPSERPFLTRGGVPYGTRLRRALFEAPALVIDIFKYEVPTALSTWEPRIIVLDVDAVEVPGGHYVQGTVRFRYRATNRVDNFVRPYKLSKPDNQT
jgi:phage baseplate assembly protein W